VKPKAFSDGTAQSIDTEVRSIIDDCYTTAKRLLTENIDKLHLMADALVEFETLSSDQIDDIMAGARPRAPGDLPPPSAGASADRGSKPAGAGEAPIGGPAEEV
jgi:cell division protease FtsH